MGHGQVARLLLLLPLEFSLLLIQASLAEFAVLLDSHNPADSALRLAAKAKFGVFQVELCVAPLTERVPGLCIVVAFAADAEVVPRIDLFHALCTVWIKRVWCVQPFSLLLKLSRSECLNLTEDIEVLVGTYLTIRVNEVRPVVHGVDVGANFAAPLTLIERYLLFRGDFCRRLLLVFPGVCSGRVSLI